MIHIAKSLAAKLLLLLLALIVLGAFLIGSMRLLTPVASSFRGEVEQWAGQQLQLPLRIGGFSARWRGLGPEIVLKSVEIESPNATHPPLKLAEIRLSLAILESLRHLTIKTRQITLSGVDLLVRRHANGSFTISGLNNFAGDSSRWFAIPSRVRLEKSNIAFDNQPGGGDLQMFRNVNAVLRNAGERHQLEAGLAYPGGGHLELKADIRGDVSSPGGWYADLYLKGRNIALSRLPRSTIELGYNILSGGLGFEIWGHWEDDHFSRMRGRSDVVQLLLRHEAAAAVAALDLRIERMGGNFLWTAEAEGWQLDVANIEFVRDGSAWPESAFSLSTRFDADRRVRLLAGTNFARAADLAAIAQVLLSQQPEIAAALRRTATQGELRDLRFEFEEKERDNLWSLQGRFESLSTQPWEEFPGVKNLDAAFWLNQDGGNLLLNEQSTVLYFPGLFRDPLDLKALKGQISWTRQQAGGWRLETPDILAVTNDIRTNTRLTIEIPAEHDKSVFMDLQTDFSDGLAINAHRYYPVGIMPDEVVAWLDRGIVDGVVTSGSALVRGPLNDFPFDKTRNGMFEVLFHSDNITIDYAPGWPRLTKVAAEVLFRHNGLDVLVDRGMIFDSLLNQTHGRIADFDDSTFELKGSVQGALQNNLRLLRESPLAGEFADYIEGMSAAGEAVTLIDLTIPIETDQAFNLDGKIDFAGSSLNLQEWQLPLTELRGNLNFTEKNIQARGLKARALGSTVTVGIETLSKPRQATRIIARAQVSSRQLARRFSEVDFEPVTGSSEWTLRLDIPHRAADATGAPLMQLSSGLRGVAVELPAPLGKRADETRTLSLSTAFPENGSRSIHMEYGPLLDLALVFEPDTRGDQEIIRGALQLGGEAARIPTQDGFEIGGNLETLDLTAWTDLLQSQTGKGTTLPLNRVALDVGRMSAGELDLDNLSLDFRREGEMLNGRFSSRQVEGEIQIPDNIPQQPVRARLKRLSLNYAPGQPDKPQRNASSSADPSRLPAIDLEVEKTEINGKDFGKLQLISRHTPTGQELQTFSLKGRQLQLSASGSWSRTDAGDQQSRLQLSMTSDSLGNLLDDLGYPKYISRAPAEFDSQLDWRDSPAGFRPDILNGQISLKLGKGQFLNVDPGIGRVFGLLNITALQRRLSLDFSDLLHKGLAFDSVEGSFELDSGDAYTTDFQITGPAAKVDISGRTGLAKEDFDQLVTVTPHLSAALPVAGLLAGGPIGGAAMLLAQGLIGKQFDKVSKRQYEVKGPWSDPLLTPVSVNQTVSDSQSLGESSRDEAAAALTPQVDDNAPSEKGSWLFETLKEQFTPTQRIYEESRE